MEEILQRAGTHAVTFALRSGLSLASGYAVRNFTKFLEKLPEKEKGSLERTRKRLQTKILIITPAIDLIELISARGNTSLESTRQLTNELKKDIADFEQQIEDIEELLQVQGSYSNEIVAQAEASISELLNRIEDAIPLISLALTTSGANLSASMPNYVSPGRLLQAANYLTIGDSQYEQQQVAAKAKVSVKGRRGKARLSTTPQPEIRIQIGPTFELKLYSIFTAAESHVTWKEEQAKCRVALWRVGSPGKPAYSYEMTIDEDFDDGRYHDNDEAKHRTIDISIITRLFFSASGKLLEIEDAKSPVLVLRLNNFFRDVAKVTDDDQDNILLDANVEWLALELYEEKVEEVESSVESSVEDDEEDEDEEEVREEEEEEGEDDYNSDSDSDSVANEESESEQDHALQDVTEYVTSGIKNLSLESPFGIGALHGAPSLSLLEYLTRLTALQQNDQESVYNIHDERISLYLRDESGHHGGDLAAGVGGDGLRTSPTSSPIGSPATQRQKRATSHSPLSRLQILRTSPQVKGTPQRTGTRPGSPPTSVITTPWERDRFLLNPRLQRFANDVMDSPLKNVQRAPFSSRQRQRRSPSAEPPAAVPEKSGGVEGSK